MDASRNSRGRPAGVQVGAVLYPACLCRPKNLLALMESAGEALI